MKKNILSIIVFAIVAVAVVGLAMWYNNKSDESMRASEAQAGAAAEQAQQQIMQNLIIKDVTVGTGATAQNGDKVTVNYVGTLDNGTKFDSSYDRGQPFSFTLGAGQVIKGWDLGVAGMKVGGKRELTIPPELGYGANGVPQAGIPANATLHFTVELLSVSTSSAPSASGQ